MKSLDKLFDEIEKHEVMMAHASLLMTVEKDVKELEDALREAVDWLDNAPFDYSNGNEAFEVDEGNVLGWKAHTIMINKFKRILGMPISNVSEYIENMNNKPVDDDMPF